MSRDINDVVQNPDKYVGYGNMQYSEAIDPIGSGREYTETKVKIEEDNDGEII